MNKVILPKQKAITVFLVFALGYYISNLLRAITATISPNLVSEFNLSAGDLGLLGGGYFLGFASVQIPLGYLLDNKGPKKIVSYFLLIAIVGIISFSLSQNFTSLLISRILIGVGVGACLMGPLTAYRVWFQDETQQRANSWMLMTGAIGMLSSSLPVQFFLPIIGWRSIFGILAILTFFSIVLIVIFIPNWDKGNTHDEKGSLKEVWQNEFFKSLVPMGFFNYGGANLSNYEKKEFNDIIINEDKYNLYVYSKNGINELNQEDTNKKLISLLLTTSNAFSEILFPSSLFFVIATNH